MKSVAVLSGAFLCAAATHAAESVTSGDEIDYMPSVIRSSDDGARIVVFERLSACAQRRSPAHAVDRRRRDLERAGADHCDDGE
ncbi:MAG: hypothetical protein ACTHK2_01180 [Dokdonella sp.]|uniref:hypothetical protein n=1 Tax=Dokdonella sp. TaxID=2291710 RepID=UPI003F8054BF